MRNPATTSRSHAPMSTTLVRLAASGTALAGVATITGPAQPAAADNKTTSYPIFSAPGTSGCNPATISNLWVVGDGHRVDDLRTGLQLTIGCPVVFGGVSFSGNIVYEINFDYKDGAGNVVHTDTIDSPLFAYNCSTSFIADPCTPADIPEKGLTGGWVHWGAFRPDVIGQVGYDRVCAKVKRKDTAQIVNGTFVGWNWRDITNYTCSSIG